MASPGREPRALAASIEARQGYAHEDRIVKLPAARYFRAVFPLRMMQWLGPLILSGIVAGFIALLVITSGYLDLSASKPHPQGWARLLHYVFRRSTSHHSAGLAIPADFGSAAQVAKGATYYGMACSHCHGGPGLGQNPIALSMRPRPQYLMREISTFSNRDLFWIVKHGVKYSAMPSYPAQDRDDEMWSIVSFLRQMPHLSTAQYRALAYGDGGTDQGGPATAPLANTFRSRGYRTNQLEEFPRDTYGFDSPSIGFDAFSIDGDAVKGCARCHVDHGTARANGAIPNIAILQRDYIRQALLKYSVGGRHSGFMQQVATQLSDAQIEQLADYYASQPKHRSDDLAPAPVLALGERIAVAGLRGRGIGACSGCHDVNRSAIKAYPAIDGQHRAYLAERMRQFRSEAATVPGGNPMLIIAKRLNDGEIDAVSAYYAAREPAAQRPTTANPGIAAR